MFCLEIEKVLIRLYGTALKSVQVNLSYSPQNAVQLFSLLFWFRMGKAHDCPLSACKTYFTNGTSYNSTQNFSDSQKASEIRFQKWSFARKRMFN